MGMPALKLGAIPPISVPVVEEKPVEKIAPAAPKKMMGLGLDLSKAKTYQQESLEKNEQIIQRAKESAVAQPEGPSLSINITNIAKVHDVPEVEQPPPIKRGNPDLAI